MREGKESPDKQRPAQQQAHGAERGRPNPANGPSKAVQPGTMSNQAANHLLGAKQSLSQPLPSQPATQSPSPTPVSTASTSPQDPERLPFVDSRDWEPGESDSAIYFRSGDRLFILPGRGYVLRLPQRPNLASFGVPAVSAAGTALVRTERGTAIMFDAGSNRGVSSAIYTFQLENLRQRMGVTTITDLHLSHGHSDHFNRMSEVVSTYRIPASNVVVPDVMVRSSTGLQATWSQIGSTPIGQSLGYDRPLVGSNLYNTASGTGVLRVDFTYGSLVVEYRTLTGAVAELNRRVTSESSTGTWVDSASALTTIRQVGTDFRIHQLGDLRGRDYHALRREMERTRPGSFAELFYDSPVLYGFQHHLGVVENPEDLQGIRDLLEVAAFSQTGLTVIVQSDNTQMRPRLVEALNRLGVDVVLALTGDQTAPANVTYDPQRGISLTGPQAQRMQALAQDRQVLERIATLRSQTRIARQYGDQFVGAGALEAGELARAQRQLSEANAEINRLLGERMDQTIGRMLPESGRGSRAAMDRITFDQTALNANAQRILAQRPIDTTLDHKELGLRLAEFAELERHSAEIEREIELARRSGEASPRLLELIQIVSPEYARQVIARSRLNRNEPPVEAQLMRQSRLLQALQTGPNREKLGGPVGRGTAGILVALEVMNAVLPIIETEQQMRDYQLYEAAKTAQWWLEKGVVPPLHGIAKADGTSLTAIPDLHDALRKHELRALEIGLITNESQWDGFRIWVTAQIQDFDDYYEHFVGPKVQTVRFKGDYFDGDSTTWEMKTWRWDDSFFGGGLKEEWAPSEPLTRIMHATARRVIQGTSRALQERWEQRKPAGQRTQEPPMLMAADTPLPRSNPVGRRRFLSSKVDRNLYSLHQQRVIVNERGWWSEPSFLELEADGLPPGYVLVTGADYSTYAAIRQAKQYVRDTRAPIFLSRDTREWPDRIFGGQVDGPEEQRAVQLSIAGLAEYDRSLATNQYRAAVRFPGEVDNQQAVGLVKSESLGPRF